MERRLQLIHDSLEKLYGPIYTGEAEVLRMLLFIKTLDCTFGIDWVTFMTDQAVGRTVWTWIERTKKRAGNAPYRLTSLVEPGVRFLSLRTRKAKEVSPKALPKEGRRWARNCIVAISVTA